MAGAQEPVSMYTSQLRIAALAERFPQRAFTSLAHHLDAQWLKTAYLMTRRDGAVGVDGQTADDFGRSLVSSNPARFTKTVADRAYYVLYEVTRVADFIEWVGRPPASGESGLRPRLHAVFLPVAEYVLAAMQVTQVFSVRLAILVLATPVFIMFTLVAIVDGLVKRDLRRWGGGRESSFVYHWAKRSALPLLVLTWVIYLALPFSLHPAFVVLPFATLFALSLEVTASAFKKYL